MSIIKGIMNLLLETPSQQSSPKTKDKYVVVKHNGRQKMYRVNQYGELFEVKKAP